MAKITLKNVRLSFPSLFNRASFDGQEGKFEATFLLNKETQADQIAKLQAAIEAAIVEAKIKVPSDKRCLKDGDEFDYDGYAGMMAFKASTKRRPTIIDRDKTPLVEDDNKPYAGCYVNAVVDIWVQNNNFGKRVNGNLFGVQFVKDGEAFGVSADCTDDFTNLDDDDI
ncbi:MAG: ssDNA-binding protein [Shewanella sp.]